MQVVINISKDDFEEICMQARMVEDTGSLFGRIRKAISHSTPLPKGHGRLIDADALVKKMEEREEKLKDDRSMWETAGVETALDMYAKTIIEADRSEEV